MRYPFAKLAVSLSLSLVAACGGGAPAPETPSTPEAPAAPGAPAAPATPDAVAPTAAAPAGPAWSDDMSKDQKVQFMKNHIMPAMQPVFQKADAKKYAEFSCKTCHGPAFKDPDDFLPHLTMKGGTITSFADKPEVSKYMAEAVVPAMAKAMGMAPYDPATQKGFGCAGCHTIDMK
jgi:hypothetical protein